MKAKTIIITLFVFLPNITLADIKYNPFTGQWENALRDSELEYNPFDVNWSHERSDSQLEYNSFTTLSGLKKVNFFLNKIWIETLVKYEHKQTNNKRK